MKTFTVLTYCSGYPYEVFRRYAGSLYDTGFTGNLVFFVQEKDRENIEKLIEEYPQVRFFVTESPYHVSNHRYKLFLDHMKDIPETDLYFLSDSRDVLFQRNFEEYPFDEDTDLFVVCEDKIIRECPRYNMKWIALVNYDALPEIIDRPILCSGTTFGTRRGIVEYLRAMTEVISQLKPEVSSRFGIDQGVHNCIVHQGKIPGIKIGYLQDSDGLINTLQYGYRRVNRKTRKIVNSKGEVPYISHQYDRIHKNFLRLLSGKYNFSDGYRV